MASGPKTMAYQPPFYAIWTVFIGGGGGLRFVNICSKQLLAAPLSVLCWVWSGCGCVVAPSPLLSVLLLAADTKGFQMIGLPCLMQFTSYTQYVSALGRWGRTQMGSDGLNRIFDRISPVGVRLILPKTSLCLLSRRILWIFFSRLPGNFALKNGGDFWRIFSGLRLPRNEARKVLEKFGENSEQNSGQNSGWKFAKFGKFSFCNFSDLKKHMISRDFDRILTGLHGVWWKSG